MVYAGKALNLFVRSSQYKIYETHVFYYPKIRAYPNRILRSKIQL